MARPLKRPKQQNFTFRTWGGARKNAGRKPKRKGAVPHKRRPKLSRHHPVHTSLSVNPKLPSLRQAWLRDDLEDCLRGGKERFGLRLVHYSVQHHHLHFIVEAEDAAALAKGMQGLAIRLARRINKRFHRHGKVFVDRYFQRILRKPKQVRNCLLYVLNNFRRHAAQRGRVLRTEFDRFSSALYFDGWVGWEFEVSDPRGPPVVTPKKWLLTTGWQRHGHLASWEVPGPVAR